MGSHTVGNRTEILMLSQDPRMAVLSENSELEKILPREAGNRNFISGRTLREKYLP